MFGLQKLYPSFHVDPNDHSHVVYVIEQRDAHDWKDFVLLFNYMPSQMQKEILPGTEN